MVGLRLGENVVRERERTSWTLIQFFRRSTVVEIVIKGPGKNALGSTVMESLLEQLSKAGGAPLLLTGDGDAFSAGLNLKEVVSLDAAGLEAFLRKFDRLAETLYTYAGPTVACVNGHAIAGGCVLALCCDYRLAIRNPRTRVGLNELALGVPFPPKTLSMVRSRLPNAHLHRVLLGADLYPPEEALALGMLDELTDGGTEVARRRLEHLASRPAAAYAATKKGLNVVGEAAAGEEALHKLASLWNSPEVKQRLSAALIKT